ncbi:MAG TPA: radical SAM protein [Candidatus Paceibacterota bacterium]|nr:radical SAM protein [Candidatus Paceibacterota bacterium]HPR91148.1 radical SAM protein [Candidatus Paceibacterota bacterium]
MIVKKEIKKQKVPNEQVFLIIAGLSCNSNCIMCSVRSSNQNLMDGSKKQIIRDLIKGRKAGYTRMEFTGGEPTIRPDLCYLVQQAKNLGYENIGISTNGVLLSDKIFCQKLVQAGLTNITFSLHAHNKKLYEAISRDPGAFSQTITGIKNALAYKQLTVSVVTVVLGLNYRYLFKIGNFIHSLGVSIWALTDLLPNKNTGNYKDLCVKRIDLAMTLESLQPLLNKFQTVIFYAFSPCLFTPAILAMSPRVSFVTAQQKLGVEKPIRYGKERRKKSVRNTDTNAIGQEKIKICQTCIFSKKCAGVWEDYLSLFGDKEIKQLANKHNCLK